MGRRDSRCSYTRLFAATRVAEPDEEAAGAATVAAAAGEAARVAEPNEEAAGAATVAEAAAETTRVAKPDEAKAGAATVGGAPAAAAAEPNEEAQNTRSFGRPVHRAKPY